MNQELYHVSANPHVRDKVTTQNLMFYVILALLPTTIFGFFNFGLSAIINVVVTTATCVIAEFAWQRRYDFAEPSLSVEEAMDQALSLVKDGYVVINEASDNPGGGAPGDGTHLLREMLKRNLPGTIMGR